MNPKSFITFKTNIFHDIEQKNDLWNLQNEIIYKTAIDYAREEKHPEIVDLLTKGPVGLNKSFVERNKKLHLRIQRMIRERQKSSTKTSEGTKEKIETTEEKDRKIEENRLLSEEVAQLKKYLSLLKKKTKEIEFVNIDDYEELSYIGGGGESSVKEVAKKEKYAKKELKEFSAEKVRHFVGEGEILFKLRHPCIIDIVGFSYGDDCHPPSIFLSLEPTSLESAISKNELSEEDKNRIIVEVVLGMRFIHRRNFMHRDLKPSNILLSKKLHVRISDFGLAREDDISITMTRNVGTLRFMAPELFEENDSVNYTNKIDVYSFGITLLYIVTGRYPAFSMKNAVNGVRPDISGKVVGWVSALICRCLSPTAENRPSFNEIFDEMKSHNYDMFSDSGDNKLTSKQRSMKKAIDMRVKKIEAYEYQHRDD